MAIPLPANMELPFSNSSISGRKGILWSGVKIADWSRQFVFDEWGQAHSSGSCGSWEPGRELLRTLTRGPWNWNVGWSSDPGEIYILGRGRLERFAQRNIIRKRKKEAKDMTSTSIVTLPLERMRTSGLSTARVRGHPSEGWSLGPSTAMTLRLHPREGTAELSWIHSIAGWEGMNIWSSLPRGASVIYTGTLARKSYHTHFFPVIFGILTDLDLSKATQSVVPKEALISLA